MRGLRLVLMFALCCGGQALSQTLTLSFVTESGGIGLSGSGTGAAGMNLGTLRAFGGTVPSGVTQQTDASSFTLLIQKYALRYVNNSGQRKAGCTSVSWGRPAGSAPEY